MPLDRSEEGQETAGHIRPNRFLLVQAGDRAERLLVRGYGEVIRPKMHEPLDEWSLRLDRTPMPLVDLLDVVIAHELREVADRFRVYARRRLSRLGRGLAAVASRRGRRLPTVRGAALGGGPRVCRNCARDTGVAHALQRERRCGGIARRLGRVGRRFKLVLEPFPSVVADEVCVVRPGAEPEPIRGDRRPYRQHPKAPSVEGHTLR